MSVEEVIFTKRDGKNCLGLGGPEGRTLRNIRETGPGDVRRTLGGTEIP